MNQRFAITAILVFAASTGCGSNATAGAADDEAKEIQRIQQQLDDGSLPEPSVWGLWDKTPEKAEAWAALFSTPTEVEPWDLAKVVRKAGGLEKYKERIAGLLHSKDAKVRGFAAVWLADLGDPAYVKDILVLLQSEELPDVGRMPKNWDREQAALALGILGSKEHAKVLAGFLRHQDARLHAGAVAGLGRMKAKEYIKEIAALLSDHDDHVVCTAIEALGRLDAKQYSDRIGGLLEAHGLAIPETALTALVMLDAKEQAPRIAGLLKSKNRIIAGRAATTLALLGADKYTQDIAALLNSEESYIQEYAFVALGILRAGRYAPEIAKHIKDKEERHRYAAAWAIVLMEAQAYAAEAIQTEKATPKEQLTPMRLDPLGGPETGIPRYRLYELNQQFAKSLARLKATRQ